MWKLEFDYLKEFIVTAEICNLSESSELLFLSQSTLSRHIRNLEESIGHNLFERTAKKIKLNPQGEIFLEYARQMMQIYEECCMAMESEETGDIVRIATFSSSGKYHLLDIMARFREENPDYQIHILEADSLFSLEKLRKGECDFAFILEQEKEVEGLERILLTKDELVLVVPNDHWMAEQYCVRIKDLCGVPIMMQGKNSYVYQLCMGLFEREQCEANVVFTSYRNENIISMIERGMGVAMMLRKNAQEYMTSDMTLVDIEQSAEVNISLVYRKTLQKRRIFKRFLHNVKMITEQED